MDNKKQKPLNLNNHIMLTIKTKHPKTMEQLVKLVHQQYTLPQQEIVECILNLQEKGKLTLKEDKTYIPKSFGSYLLSSNSYWYWITVILALASTITIFTIQENVSPIIYLRYISGAVFVIFLPGYTLIKALFPANEFDNIELIALSLGMSLALVPFIGLILNYTRWGIKTTTLTLSLLVLTTIFATVAILREHQNKASLQHELAYI